MDMFQDKNVINLTGKDFKILDGKKHVEVINKEIAGKDGCFMIYAPWCPHCQDKEQTITKLCKMINPDKSLNFKVGVANGDSPDMRDVVRALGLEGFPTFYHISCTNGGKSIVTDFTIAGTELIATADKL